MHLTQACKYQNVEKLKYADELSSGIANGRVLAVEQKLKFLHLTTFNMIIHTYKVCECVM